MATTYHLPQSRNLLQSFLAAFPINIFVACKWSLLVVQQVLTERAVVRKLWYNDAKSPLQDVKVFIIRNGKTNKQLFSFSLIISSSHDRVGYLEFLSLNG